MIAVSQALLQGRTPFPHGPEDSFPAIHNNWGRSRNPGFRCKDASISLAFTPRVNRSSPIHLTTCSTYASFRPSKSSHVLANRPKRFTSMCPPGLIFRFNSCHAPTNRNFSSTPYQDDNLTRLILKAYPWVPCHGASPNQNPVTVPNGYHGPS